MLKRIIIKQVNKMRTSFGAFFKPNIAAKDIQYIQAVHKAFKMKSAISTRPFLNTATNRVLGALFLI